MSYEFYIGVMDEESVLVECGPMHLVIRAWNGDQPQITLSRRAAEKSIAYLEVISNCRPLLSRPWPQITDLPENELARRMVASVKAVGDQDLTPMAAVAGTIADAVADWLFEKDVTRVIVDNGGDISIRLLEDQTVSVGIRPQIASPQVSHVLILDAGRNAYGVTTSGMGGRSFTKGIASAVSVLAATASQADAASTAIANACMVEDDRIVQIAAETMDAHSDLAGTLITADVGRLDPEKTSRAMESALEKAEYLSRSKTVIGAFVALEGQFAYTDGLKPYIFAVSGTAGSIHC